MSAHHPPFSSNTLPPGSRDHERPFIHDNSASLISFSISLQGFYGGTISNFTIESVKGEFGFLSTCRIPSWMWPSSGVIIRFESKRQRDTFTLPILVEVLF